jgi:nucleotide-binding universal stress UspA family protein
MISTILVPTDGSKTSQKAGIYAVDLAKQLDASIIVISVMDKRLRVNRTMPVGRSSPGVAESIDDYQQETAERFVGAIKKLCDKKDVQSKTVIKSGHPVEEIVKEAVKSKADLIIMGTHGQSALAAAALGSVTYGVIHKDAEIPILLVRR